MSRYLLSKRVYDTMVGRGYRLVCRRCNCPLQINDMVESKHSKYRRWKCAKCGRLPQRATKRGLVEGIITLVCKLCGGRVYIIGRKFYHASCYDDMHMGVA